MRKVVITLVALLGGVAVLLGTAFLFREEVLRYGASAVLGKGQLTLTRLQGLDIGSTQLSIAELEFLLDESGQTLVIEGLDLDLRFTSFSTAPAINAVTIASVQLLANGTADAGMEEEGAPEARDGTLLSEVLTLLREFPLGRVEVRALALPQHTDAFAFELQRDDSQLYARLASGPLLLQAQFAQQDAAAAAQLDVTLKRDTVDVGVLAVTLQPLAEVYALTGSGRLDIPDLNALLGELDQAPLPVPLQAAQLEWTLAGNIADDLRGATRAAAPQTFTLGLQSGSTLTMPAELASGLDAVTLAFTDSADFVVTSGAGLSVSSERMPLHVASTWQGQALVVDAVLGLDACELAAVAACALDFNGNASFGAYTLSGAIQVSAADSAYKVQTQGLSLGGLPGLVPAFDIAATINVDDSLVSFSTPLRLSRAAADAGISMAGTYDLAAGSAQLHLDIPELTFTDTGAALSSWFGSWPYAFDVLAGSFTAQLDLAREAGAWTGKVDGDLRNLGGLYGDYFFGGLNGALRADISLSSGIAVTTPPLTLRAASIDIGLPLTDVDMAFSLNPGGVLHIDSVLAHVLDGTISGANITYDPGRERNDVLVKFAGLRMERMLDLVDYQGVEAIGAVSGEVPLTITPAGVEVAAGVLAADAPGSIRYLAANAGATGNAGLDLVNQALGNYQFESLTSGIEYKPDGELVLSMKLQGGNPDMSGGQRINVNLNLSDDIPALLKSLQAARAIEDFLAEQYR